MNVSMYACVGRVLDTGRVCECGYVCECDCKCVNECVCGLSSFPHHFSHHESPPSFSFQSQTHPWKQRGDSSLPFDICEGSSKKLLLRSRNQCLTVIPRWELLHYGNDFNVRYLPHATSSPLLSHLMCLRGQ